MLWSRLVARLNLRTRYTRALEEEIARLRAENRALINSILGVAGIPPMHAAARAAASTVLAGAPSFAPGAAPAAQLEKGAKGGNAFTRAVLRRPSFIRRNSEQNAAGAEPSVDATFSRHSSLVTRHCSSRRRSWQQIGRALEIEDARAARRERESNPDTFPTPRNVVGKLS